MRQLLMIAVPALAAALSLYAGARHDFPRPVFVFRRHPDLPVSRFFAGELGIPEPLTSRIYLIAFYRFLNNQPLASAERQAWLDAWNFRAEPPLAYAIPAPERARWYALRRQPVPEPASLHAARYTFYRGVCAESAFTQARETLANRRRSFGASSREVQWWLDGQDAVFASCDPGNFRLPPALPAGAPLALQQDRSYQTASALLYGLKFDRAAAAFREIAADRSSPWRLWAPYLIGRSLLWKARLTEAEPARLHLLRSAGDQFLTVLRDPALAPTHAAAERLLTRCLLATDPARALDRLALRLAQPAADPDRAEDLVRFLEGFDGLDEKTPRPAGDLSRWIVEMQRSGHTAAYPASLAAWQRTRLLAWLLAALTHASAQSPAVGGLIEAARAVPASHPGSAALHYHAARLALDQGRAADARQTLDQLAGRLASQPSALNRVRSLRMLAAATVEEFVARAPRQPILDSGEWDTAELSPASLRAREWNKAEAANMVRLAQKPWLDDRAEAVFSLRLPLDTLLAISQRVGALPPHLAEELDLAVWTRAVLLGQWTTARAVAPRLASRYASAAPRLRLFLNAPGGAAAEEAAAFALLLLPGAKPYLARGYGRSAEGIAPTRTDDWLKNWWYGYTESDMQRIYVPYRGDQFSEKLATSVDLPRSLPFLTPAEEQRAAAEFARLQRDGAQGHDWIARRVLDWARRHAKGPPVAQALFQLVTGNRASWFVRWSPAEAPTPSLKAAQALFQADYGDTPLFQKAQEMRYAR